MSENVLEVKIPFYNQNGFSLSDISFSLEKGYVAGLFGLNGAGKTTLIRLLTGNHVLPPNAEIYINGFSMKTEEKEAKNSLGFVFDRSLFPDYIKAEDVGDFFGRYYNHYHKKTYLDYLERFEISPKMKLRKLSAGMSMKQQLAFALSHEAALLVMDEPTASLDPVFREEFSILLSEITSSGDCSVLLSSQLVSEQEAQADYCLFLHQGRQIYYGATEDLLEDYLILRGRETLFPYLKSRIIGTRTEEYTAEALIRNDNEPMRLDLSVSRPHLEDILYYVKTGTLTKEVLENGRKE